MLFDQEILDAQETEPTLKKMPHDDQDPLNDCEGEKRRKRRRNASESSSKSSKKDKAPTDSTNDDIPVDQPQDKVEELIQNHPNSECILGLSTIMVAKKFKEIIKKEELTTADLEGVGFEMLKSCYKNDVELEYHVNQIKAAIHFYNSDFYYLAYLSMEKKYTSSLTKHYATRYYIEGIEDTILDRWSKEIYKYHVDALVVIKNKIEDTQLGVESYQRTLNLNKPKFYILGIDHKIPYMTTETEKGVVYLNKYGVKSLMLRKEVHKFCDGTLVKVQDNLLKMLKENRLGRENENLIGRNWTKIDTKRSKAILEVIENTLKHRE
nr:hypothetical protein [Tanacetum cinerariifolium]